MVDDNLPASAEWRKHWPLVIASMAGLSFAAVAANSLGLFIEPLSQEFGWSRAEISLGLSIFALIAVPLSPFVGALIDRWGARRLAIPGIILSATAFATFSLANGSLTLWIAQWIFYSIAALAIRTTIWTAAVSSMFSKGRGLALAVTLSGSAITHGIAPILAQWLIDHHGWRNAYLWIGVGWGGFVLALLVPLFFDARDRHRGSLASRSADEPVAPLVQHGLTVREAIRSHALIRIAVATLLTIVTMTALTVHLVPILNEREITRATAALMVGSAGITSVCGKLLTGWVLDRWSSGLISAISLALPGIACLILLNSSNHFVAALIGILILGYAGGAFLQVCTYLTSRYAGMRNFGKIFGFMASLLAVGTGTGPFLAGLIYDQSGSYALLLTGVIPISLVSSLLLLGLGPYPTWASTRSDAEVTPR